MKAVTGNSSIRRIIQLINSSLSRDDKRYTEKKNKSERARRKKEDIARVRNLVDMTLAVDPRIKRIRQEEKEAREAKKKKGKQNGPAGKSQAEIEEEKKTLYLFYLQPHCCSFKLSLCLKLQILYKTL